MALAGYLGVAPEKLAGQKLRLMGHSLGAAVALQFALRHHADRIILAAPFTTLRAMADKAVTPWLGWMLRHNFDNLSAIAALLKGPSPPRIIVTHGTADEVIPIEMSREIKSRWPDSIELVEVKGADHEYILDDIESYMAPDLPHPVTSLKQAMQAASESAVISGASTAKPLKNSP
jgi:pimeloyl-ACP methyl ester carboxylesterase